MKIWNPTDSLIAYNVSRHRSNREVFERAMDEAKAEGKRALRLRSPRAVERLLARTLPGEEQDEPTAP